MAKYFILVKRECAKGWLGAIPTKQGITIKQARSAARRKMRKGFTFKVINKTELKKIYNKINKNKR